MTTPLNIIAVDLGADSGRVLSFAFDGTAFTTTELHRFSNTPRVLSGHLRWHWAQLQADIAKGLALAADHHPASVGVDTWGVDHALLDAAGNVLFDPIHYRDEARNSPENVARLRAITPVTEIFNATGIQDMSINTLYQWFWYTEHAPELLRQATTSLFVPDLINYWLSGVKANEYTITTTSQMFDPRRGQYATELLDKLHIPTQLFPEVVPPGTRLGTITLDHPLRGVPLIAPATHDTGSAVAAVPARDSHYAFLSSGTWSLLGLELPKPLINADAMRANATNEGGVGGTIRFLKNIMGLWLIQESRRTWNAAGQTYTHAELVALAAAAEPFRAFIDPNAPDFLPPGDIPGRIQAFCGRTGQRVPETVGEIARCIFESLALKYRMVLDELIALSGQRVDVLHIIGGGANNRLLCQMAANATGRDVLAGPAEATALGNALVQLVALGEIGSVAEGRAIIRGSITPDHFTPERAGWDAAFARFEGILQRANTQTGD